MKLFRPTSHQIFRAEDYVTEPRASRKIEKAAKVFERSGKQTFWQMLRSLQVLDDLDFCLDAAATASYPGQGQIWFDLSGNGNNFYLGQNDTEEASNDPTFQGVAGGLSENEYFTKVSSGNRSFWYVNTTAPFAQAWFKNDAKFTLVVVARPIQFPTVVHALFSSLSSGVSNIGGIQILCGAANVTDAISLNVARDSTAAGFSLVESNNFGDIYGVDRFIAVSIDEAVGANGLTFRVDSTTAKKTSTYSSPGTQTTVAPTIIGLGDVGARIYCMAAWSRRLSDSELDSIQNKLKERYTNLS